MADGRIDGKFVIQKGNGITQGIANELGLSKQECKQIGGSIWTQVIQEFNNSSNMQVQNNNGINPNSDNNFMVHENAVVTLSKECWTKIVTHINNALGKNIQVEDAENIETAQTFSNTQATDETTELTTQQIQRKNEHEAVVKQSVELLKSNWDATGLGDHFNTPEDKALFLQCLDEVKYQADNKEDGSGHAENGTVYIETNNSRLKSTSEMTKLLIHEANHAFLQRKAIQNKTLNYPTKAEEIECETLGLTATAKLVNSGKLESFEEYEHPVEYYDTAEKVHNTPGFQVWLKGYNKLADNLNGDITIQRHPESKTIPEGTIQLGDDDSIIVNRQNYIISPDGKLEQGAGSGAKRQVNSDEIILYRGNLYKLSAQDLSLERVKDKSISIKGGDTLSIEGFPSITIGTDAMLEGIENTCITQLIVHNQDFSKPKLLGDIIFDDMQPTAREKEIAHRNNQASGVRFTITKTDGSTITGTCYPNTEVLKEHLTNLGK